MITGGNATLYVRDMDAAVAFYTERLGLPLRFRAGNHWAEVQAGDTLVIGLHPTGPHLRPAGVPGSVQVGLTVDRPLEEVVRELSSRGVVFEGPIVGDEKSGLRFANLKDMDGNALYLWQQVGAAT
jgi:catechol 2,3-dioxygenase-like lactoylglutathione lyase family enzyme